MIVGGLPYRSTLEFTIPLIVATPHSNIQSCTLFVDESPFNHSIHFGCRNILGVKESGVQQVPVRALVPGGLRCSQRAVVQGRKRPLPVEVSFCLGKLPVRRSARGLAYGSVGECRGNIRGQRSRIVR